MRLRIIGLLLGLLSIVSALSATGSKLLVILEEESEKNKYSEFWADLENRGFQITTRSPKDSSLSLFLHGEPAYSHLLILPPKSKGLGPALTPNLIVDFINAGSNVLLALSSESSVPSSVSSLLLELDISLPPDRNSLVVDHFNYDTKSAGEKHDVLLLPSPDFSRREGGVKNFFFVDSLIALPHSVGQVLGNASPLLTSVLKAPSTAYIYNPKDDAEALEDLFATGPQINLVSAFQARNSARFTVLGSAEALEDKWFAASVQLPGSGQKSISTANRAFAQKLTSWTFKETGVLKIGPIRHWLNEPPQKGTSDNAKAASKVDLNPAMYRIKNDVHYSIQISEWSTDKWIPFTPPGGDTVQLEISMLSPFHRLNLHPLPEAQSFGRINRHNSTLFWTDFTLPDQHGIFNFLVEYRRAFFTNVEVKTTVSVRHFAHDEWPRSFVISGAWPWIGGVWVTVVGWVGFVGLWLYSAKPKAGPGRVGKEGEKGGGVGKR